MRSRSLEYILFSHFCSQHGLENDNNNQQQPEWKKKYEPKLPILHGIKIYIMGCDMRSRLVGQNCYRARTQYLFPEQWATQFLLEAKYAQVTLFSGDNRPTRCTKICRAAWLCYQNSRGMKHFFTNGLGKRNMGIGCIKPVGEREHEMAIERRGDEREQDWKGPGPARTNGVHIVCSVVCYEKWKNAM